MCIVAGPEQPGDHPVQRGEDRKVRSRDAARERRAREQGYFQVRGTRGEDDGDCVRTWGRSLLEIRRHLAILEVWTRLLSSGSQWPT